MNIIVAVIVVGRNNKKDKTKEDTTAKQDT